MYEWMKMSKCNVSVNSRKEKNETEHSHHWWTVPVLHNLMDRKRRILSMATERIPWWASCHSASLFPGRSHLFFVLLNLWFYLQDLILSHCPRDYPRWAGKNGFLGTVLVSVLSPWQIPERNNLKEERFMLVHGFSSWSFGIIVSGLVVRESIMPERV
jgi:hypothetical protein